MGSAVKRIGILTGGGDCPGLNAVIRAVAKTAMLDYGWEVLGVEDGFLGLIENRLRPLGMADVSNIVCGQPGVVYVRRSHPSRNSQPGRLLSASSNSSSVNT